MSKYDKKYENFLDLPKREQKFIAKNIELEKGIARNRALLDNLFALFITINTKVPIFIVGKPGCSKSLSVQLINKAMKGNSSNNPIFKNLPRIITSSFQGSMGSTSKGVKNVFKKARAILKNINQTKNDNGEQEIISMIFFDEMGLAEHSPNNPLKVIHSELEYDLNEADKKIAFVGISNWSLDASKMNRGLYLSIPDPDKNDVKKTSRTIGKSYDEELARNYRAFFESLGLTYIKYKTYLYENLSNGFEEFHGNRDFYHLIKNVANNMVKENKKSINDEMKTAFVKEAIERNFAGLTLKKTNETSIKRIKNIYTEFDNNMEIDDHYDVLQRISQNILDLKSRYLLIISYPSISEFLISSTLKDKNKEYNYYKGSPFKDDSKSEEYILKILNKVQLNMEQNKVLILNNLEVVYPALYDLFNQNFTEVGKKNYARIALGYTTNAFSFVNDNFRCIVNVDEDKIEKEESPFLNRFEKHVLSFENLLDKKELSQSYDIYDTLLELTKCDEENKSFAAFNYNLKDIFINLDKEEINGYIYKLKKNGIKPLEFPEKVIEKLSLLIPKDIMLFLKYSGYESRFPVYSRLIKEGYEKGEHINLSLFLKKMNNLKNVVYTFSDVFNGIQLDSIDNGMLGKINSENISEIRIGSINSENKFEDELNDFFNDKSKKLCLIEFNFDERHFLNYVKFFIENKEKDNENVDSNYKKAFIFIVCLNRNYKATITPEKGKEENEEKNKCNETISLTSEYYQIFIDDLKGEEKYSIKNFLILKGKDLFKKYIDYEQRLNQDIYQTFTYMDYSFPYSFKEINRSNYIKKLIRYIQDDKNQLKKRINAIIIDQLEKDENIIINAFKNKNLVDKYDTNIISSIERYLNEIYTQLWNNFYYKVEKAQFFSTLLSLEEKTKKPNNQEMIIIDEKEEDEDKEEDKENNIKKENEHRSNIIKRAIDIYLGEFKFEDDNNAENVTAGEEKTVNNVFKVIEDLGVNHIDIILGLNLPGIYPFISYIIKRSRNEIFKKNYFSYFFNEIRLRSFINDKNVQDEKTRYLKKLKSYNEYLKNDLDKIGKIYKIEKNDLEKKEFTDSFLEDYYTIFIYNNVLFQQPLISGFSL